MSFDPNHNPPWLCPVCNVWMYGRDRFDHMKRHIRPETAKRIKEDTGAALDDFVGFCLQQGFELDDLAADDPKVAEAIAVWEAGGDLPDDDLDRLIGLDPRPDPEIWGDLVGELVADPEESPDDEDLRDPFAGLPDDDEEPVEIQLTILWEIGVGTRVVFAGRVTGIEGLRRFRVHDGTDDVAVELAPDVEALAAVGDLVAVTGRKMRDDRGPYIEAERVDQADQGRPGVRA